MDILQKGRYGIDPYLDWVKKEGIPVWDNYYLYLFEVETAMWPRYGVKGAACHLTGRGDFANMFLFDIPPGGATTPQRHLYEDVVYILEGQGNTQLEFADGTKRSFEWGPRSMFAIPLNAKYRHFNGSGQKRALMVHTTNMPLVMNTFHSEKFIFDTDVDFPERIGKDEYFSGGGDLIMVRPGNHMWETNFVPDMAELKLTEWDERGAGATNLMFVLADGVMQAHISEMPSGTYKKGHRHGSGAHVTFVAGEGYSLCWYDGEKDFQRIDWKHGVVFPPVEKQFHQHFNTGTRPARYFASGVGSIRYPLLAIKRRSAGTLTPGAAPASATSVKDGGDQIEYEDQDPRIHPLWLDEMRKNGATPKMEKYFPDSKAKPAAE